MNKRPSPDRFTTHPHLVVILLSFILIIAVALRRRYDLVSPFNLGWLVALLGLFAVLFASEPLISSRIKLYRWLYFTVQLIIVQLLAVFQEYQDTWAVLYIALGFQVAVRCPRKEAWGWFSLFATSLMVTLCVEFGLVSGPGRAMAYGLIGVLFISYDIQYARHEDALAESQVLVAELQEAHRKLVEYASQGEKLAALLERNRMIGELYDSVGQKVFAIQLAAETTRLVLDKDPRRATEQVAGLQELTQSTLGQMRQLIDQWRPG
jgi:signal transduction histidine kinase